MTKVDWIGLALVAVGALAGLRRGLIASTLAVAGVVAGAVLGARLAPHFLHGGSHSPYTPLVALVGATLGAIALETAGTMVGTALRGGLRVPPLRALDSAAGAVLGAFAALAVIWVAGAVALLLPGQTSLRRGVQRSTLLRGLNDVVPPNRILRALATIDPLPSLTGPQALVAPPDPLLLKAPGVRRAAPSVVKVLGTACGISVEGTGWVARGGFVVTAAHVVAGEDNTVVAVPGGTHTLEAQAVAFDKRNDVAVLRVPGLRARALPLGDAREGLAIAILGYPEDGPFAAKPARIGRTVAVLSQDAYGHGPVLRTITSIRGLVEHGDSGGPGVDEHGAVVTMVFASRVGERSGLGVPPSLIRRALGRAGGPVSTGGCAG